MPDYEGWPLRPVNGAALFKSETPPVSVQRGQKKKERQEKLEAAYGAVDRRDAGRCRVTGRRVTPGALDASERRERHHLVPRSRSVALRDDPRNIVTVSALVHRLITAGWIEHEGTDANKVLTWHWTKLAKSKPIVIKRWNPRGEKE